ncbi:universal stress protein [Pseudaminobacter soli (ex Li et al. 2025)]|uniref:universal stress protein n=1 Tax=Pseudaminobacter soli (ex Li et al. 2025) TaxID=1295366 RepID=UPI003CD031AA
MGLPGPEIVNAAKEWEADLVVVGGHIRKGLARVSVGSVAETVMREALCPLLVVRAKQ